MSGSVTEREWTDKDGNTKKAVNVRVNEVALMGRREEEKPKKSNDFDDDDSSIPF